MLESLYQHALLNTIPPNGGRVMSSILDVSLRCDPPLPFIWGVGVRNQRGDGVSLKRQNLRNRQNRIKRTPLYRVDFVAIRSFAIARGVSI